MDLNRAFAKNKKYKKRKLRIVNFAWVDIGRLHIPWWPVCVLHNEHSKEKEMCPVLPRLMKDENGEFSTLLKYSMHVELLDIYDGCKDKLLATDLWRDTRYYALHKSYRDRGIDSQVRTDGWIRYKIERMLNLYKDIKERGYNYETKNLLAVLDKPLGWYYGHRNDIDGYEICDGGHRAACLYKLGYDRVKAIILKPIKLK